MITGKLDKDAGLIILEQKETKNMPKPLSERKWGITKHAFYQAYHFALRYTEFRDILKYKTDTVGSQDMDGMPKGNGSNDATQNLAQGNGRKFGRQRCGNTSIRTHWRIEIAR